MPLKDQIQTDLTAAMRSGDDDAKRALRMALAAITKSEVSGTEVVVLDDAGVIGVLRSEIKRRTEAAEMYDTGGRADRADAERAEAAVLGRYLPAEMSDDALAAIVAEEIATAEAAGTTGPKAMGVVIKAVRARVGDEADGSRIAATVKAALGL